MCYAKLSTFSFDGKILAVSQVQIQIMSQVSDSPCALHKKISWFIVGMDAKGWTVANSCMNKAAYNETKTPLTWFHVRTPVAIKPMPFLSGQLGFYSSNTGLA